MHWAAWQKLAGMTESAAKLSYAELVKKLDPTFESPDIPLNDSMVEQPQKTINIVVEEDGEATPTRVVIQEDNEGDNLPPVTIAAVDVPQDQEPVDIAIERTSSGVLRTTALSRFGGLRTSRDSPVPTWAVFFLGVLFLCFLDDNVSVGNMVMNGLGVSLLTAAIISLQIK